tara:strand:+ start:10547 stop:15073 length:4527 start_codon:yes stop_codon:yes gene_type:complete
MASGVAAYKYISPEKFFNDIQSSERRNIVPEEIIKITDAMGRAVMLRIEAGSKTPPDKRELFKGVLIKAALQACDDGQEFINSTHIYKMRISSAEGGMSVPYLDAEGKQIPGSTALESVDVQNIAEFYVISMMSQNQIPATPSPVLMSEISDDPGEGGEKTQNEDTPPRTYTPVRRPADVPQAAIDTAVRDSHLKKMAENKSFDEQCFMMAYLNNYASWYRTKITEEEPLKHIMMAETDSATPIINSFSNFPDLRSLQNLTTDKLSYMYPKIKLRKVYVHKTAKGDFRVVKTKPFVFETSETKDEIDKILESNQGRGTGVGIQSFNWKYTGDNPATAQRLIEATLKIYIQDLGFFVRGFPEESNRADYTDLISFSSAKNSPSQPTSRKTKLCDPFEQDVMTTHTNEIEQFEIEAEVGWNVPKDKQNTFFSTEELKAIEAATTVVKLITKEYDFNFNQDGTVELTVEYIGRIEAALETNKADIFAESAEEKQVREQFESNFKIEKKQQEALLNAQLELIDNTQYEEDEERNANARLLAKDKISSDAVRTLEATKYELESEYREMRHERFSALLEYIESLNRIYFAKFNIDTIAKCIDGKVGANYTFLANAEPPPKPFTITEVEVQSVKKAKSASMEMRNKARNRAKKAVDATAVGKNKPKGVSDGQIALYSIDLSDNYIFPFIYVGDILEAAAKIMGERFDQTNSRYRIITSSFVYRDLNCKRKVVNIADIPISMAVFTNWYTDNFTRRLRNSLPFVKFVRKLMADLVFKALGAACFDDLGLNSGGVKTRINTMTVSSQLDKKLKELRRFPITEILEDRNRPKKSTANEQNYEYIILSCDIYPLSRSGNRREDEEKGIMHMHVGRDRGLIKEINFSKVDIPGLRESLITNGSPLDKMRLPFNTSVTMFGYPYITPGCRFYVDPTFSGMGNPKNDNSVARKLGLGGYYIATVVDNTISADGSYVTEINGQFEGWPKDAPIVLQEKDNNFTDNLKIEKPPIGARNQDFEMWYSENAEIYDAESIDGTAVRQYDFNSPMMAVNRAVVDALLERDGLVAGELTPEEDEALRLEAYRLVADKEVDVRLKPGTDEVISVRFLESWEFGREDVGTYGAETQQEIDERENEYYERRVRFHTDRLRAEGNQADIEKGLPEVLAMMDVEIYWTPERVLTGQDLLQQFNERSERFRRERWEPQKQAYLEEREKYGRYANKLELIPSLIQSGNNAALDREIILYYEALHEIYPTTDGKTLIPSRPKLILAYRDAGISEPRLVNDAGIHFLRADIQVDPEHFGGVELVERIVGYRTREERQSYNLLLVSIKIEGTRNYRMTAQIAGNAAELSTVASKKHAFEVRTWESTGVLNTDKESTIQRVKDDAQSTFGGGITYEYHITDMSSPELRRETRTAERQFEALVENYGLSESEMDAQDLARLARRTARSLENFASSSQTGTLEEYNDNLDFLLTDEEELFVRRRILATQTTGVRQTSEFDRERRGRQLVTAYPYAGPDLTRR